MKRSRTKSRKSRNRKPRFEYKRRSKKDIQERANQQGGQFDSFTSDNFPRFSAPDGDSNIRILPPTFEDAKHYGVEVWVHYQVGPDNQSYACLSKMKNKRCPVCEEIKRAQKEGDEAYAKEIKATKRVLFWMIDRNNEDKGPQIYPCPWTVDRNIASVSIDKQTGEVLWIDDPEDGYDVFFTKTPGKPYPKYGGETIARKPTPLCDDEDLQAEWLELIQDNPLPDTMVYYDYDHIASVFAGAEPDDDEDEEDEDEDEEPIRTRRKRSRVEPDEDEDEEDEETYESVYDEVDDDEEDEIDDEDEDLDEDDEDEDEDDEPPPPKKRKGKAGKSRARRRRVEPEEDDEDEEDEEPPRKSRKRTRSDRRPGRAAKSRGSVREKVKGGLRRRRQ